MTSFFILVNLEYKRFYKAEGMFKSLNSRTVTCTRELISIYMCYSQGDGLNTPLSRLSYLVLYTVVHLSLYLVFVRYQVPYVLDAHDELFRWSGTRVTCEMVSDGGGRFIPAGIVDFHTLYLLLAFLVAHDRATEDNHTHHTGEERYDRTQDQYSILVRH